MTINDVINTDQQIESESKREFRISVRSLWKVFGSEPDLVKEPEHILKSKSEIQDELGLVVALRDVDFDVYEGETFVVMGLSGSGKSTLVRCLIRLIEPSSGEIYVDDEDIINLNDKGLTTLRRKKTAMVFQHFGLLPNRTIIDNVAFGLEIQGVGEEERHNKAREMLELVGLTGWGNAFSYELSGGMQQRVGLARALAVDPEILLMDEPFSALDPLIRREMQSQLLELQSKLNKTIVFITHDLDEALILGERIAIMRDGEIVQIGSPQEIVDNPSDSYVEDFIKGISKTRVLGASTIMTPVLAVASEGQSPTEVLSMLEKADQDYAFVLNSSKNVLGVLDRNDMSTAVDNGETSIQTHIISDSPTYCIALENTTIDDLLPLSAVTDCPIAVLNEQSALIGVVTRTTLLSTLAENQSTSSNEN
jgi:glycine betaine/proline transport system ATP-binding protein